MSAVVGLDGRSALPGGGGAAAGSNSHSRSKSSVLRSFMGGHKRNNSDGSVLPSSFSPQYDNGAYQVGPSPTDMNPPSFFTSRQPPPLALGELAPNRQSEDSWAPPRYPYHGQASQPPSPLPQKSTFSLRSPTKQQKPPKDSSGSPTKPPKKVKSVTSFSALLSRPKSSKNLKQQVADDESRRQKDKENRTPPGSLGNNDPVAPPPIYAQFASQPFAEQLHRQQQQSHYISTPQPRVDSDDYFGRQMTNASERPSDQSSINETRPKIKPRPKSFQYYVTGREKDKTGSTESKDNQPKNDADNKSQKRLTWGRGGPNVRQALSNLGLKTKSSAASQQQRQEPVVDPKDIDTHLEALLDRRNIPENQRYKMRNLTDTIKMEFIRQDWAETQSKLDQEARNEGDSSPVDGGGGGIGGGSIGSSDHDDGSKKKQHTRGRTMTLARGGNKTPSVSPVKKQKKESSIGRHWRTKSTDSVASDYRPTSSGNPSITSGIVAKVKGHQVPADFVSYLRKVQQPQLVEVGKLHKLRLLLRNETVAWTEDFIKQGGMKETVELLHRILTIEWREEHEDALLHENLLCLKALCTTALALQYLHSIHATLFPALLHMIFDPEKKGPSEFTTRNIVTSVLLTYIECATPQERVARAQRVLGYLRDPEPKEEERPVEFVLEMRRQRPYRVWCKEAVSVTKEVFWIFLHNLNVVALPPDKSSCSTTATNNAAGLQQTPSMDPSVMSARHLRYMARHFPQERPPVPAAPYVGGVEWDATNYLASHLDLMNAIVACTGPTAEDRNKLRAELRISGWERCLGGSFRMCKEKFYGSVHDGLRTWVAAAADDGWDVRDVRYGPPPESRSASPVKRAGGGANKQIEPPPRIEIPRLDFNVAVEAGGRANEPWLS
ncbi:armadillo-type protein [Bombardia bombarda]|uniref:Armadillo-type protein n=1 Tax=Bombardia bombarda TaxID=252184 RepID=A0AA39X7W9_9PEZI|nr:armadillo-type protein [Bombardia bombarda]